MPLTHLDDRVWFDTDTKLRQLCNEVANAPQRQSNVLVLSHFETTVAIVDKLLREKAVRHERFSLFDSSRLTSSAAGSVWLGTARSFQAPSALNSVSSSTPLEIIVSEHHPRASRDREIVLAAQKLPGDTLLCFYFSLDDPVMKHFGSGETVQNLFLRLEMPANECITHPLVTNAIRKAQEEIEKQVPKDFPTQSVEDWFKYNLPEKKS